MARKPRKQNDGETREYVPKSKKQKQKEQLQGEALKVLEHWNSKRLVVHRPDNQELTRYLPIAMERYDIEDIIEAIDNYAAVFFDDNYVPWPGYKKYKHTLMSFMAYDKAVCQFMNDGKWWVQYRQYQSQNETATAEKEASCDSRTKEEGGLYFDCLAWLKTVPYVEYIKSEHWQHFRKEAFKHFNGTCQLCGRTNEQMELHHKTYINRGRETFNDVILLCSHCHELYHHNRDHCQCARCNGDSEQHEMISM